MVERGLFEEAKQVYQMKHLNSLNTVGLKEIFDWFDAKFSSEEEVITRIQKNTRVYAKKQITWFKKDPHVINMNFEDPYETNIAKILSLLQSQKS